MPAGAFHPRPKVDSAVLRLTPLAEPLVATGGAVERSAGSWSGCSASAGSSCARGLRELTGWDAGRGWARCSTGPGSPPASRPEVVAPATFAALLRALVDGGWTAR